VHRRRHGCSRSLRGGRLIADVVNLDDFQALAEQRLDPAAYDYYAGGAEDEIALARNRSAYQKYEILYRVLVDVSKRAQSTTVLGQPIATPIIIAPTAFHKLAHPDGELATARAAAKAGTVMILSTLSNTRIEDVVAASSGPVWFQVYVHTDKRATEGLVRRAEEAGARVLVLTVDVPQPGRRERDVRNRFHLPEGLRIENLVADGYGDMKQAPTGSGMAAYFGSIINPSLTWKDIDWLRKLTQLPLVVKGIVRADDAVRAVEHGARGIMVSNHGGRQLDSAPATIDVLAEIADAVGGRTELFVDGGIRRGGDVLKAIALGAKAVLVGRPTLWGLAAGGEAGVVKMLEMLSAELDNAMALAGCATVADITRDLVRIR
jgi:4-hydroxymandelate oxidase